MDISIAEAKNRLPKLIRAVESGDSIVITRHGKPVAQLTAAPPESKPMRWGGMRSSIELLPGWDDPIDRDRFLDGNL